MQPLFEREQRVETLRMQQLQEELAEAKGLLSSQARRQNELEYVNEDLEKRLESEARERISLESLRDNDLRRIETENRRHQCEIKEWELRLEEEGRRRRILEDRLRRVEKELYRMHQKKYEIERKVREEMKSAAKHEAIIVQNIREDSNRVHYHKRNPVSVALDHVEGSYTSRQHNATSFDNMVRYMNPQEVRPSAIRIQQVCQTGRDFFGI